MRRKDRIPRKACDKEMGARDKNGTFELVILPRWPIGAKWEFALKDSDLHKPRRVVLGNFQEEGINHQEIE